MLSVVVLVSVEMRFPGGESVWRLLTEYVRRKEVNPMEN